MGIEKIRWGVSDKPTMEYPVQFIIFIFPVRNGGENSDNNLCVRIPFNGAFEYEHSFPKPSNIFEAWDIAKIERDKVKWGFWQSNKLYH